MNIVCVIPARYSSSRLPGKPLMNIAGKPMIWWVYQEAKKVRFFSEIYVATESAQIVERCQELDLNVILTSDKHPTGTDRVAEVAQKIMADGYLIWMGDEPLITSREVEFLISESLVHKDYFAYILGKPFDSAVDVVNSTTIKLAINKNKELIFVSRSAIPFPKATLGFEYYKNIGAYLMTREALEFFLRVEIGLLEEIEEIEILRLLENHKKVYVALLKDSISMSVDTHKDLKRVCSLIRQSPYYTGGGGVNSSIPFTCNNYQPLLGVA